MEGSPGLAVEEAHRCRSRGPDGAHAGGALVAKLAAEDAITVFLKDGSAQAWVAVTGAGATQDFHWPLRTEGTCAVNFSAAGDVWVLYQPIGS